MKMKQAFFAILVTLSINANAFYFHEIYKNGQIVCEENKDQRTSEIFKWVKVPIDYSNIDRGTTKLYTYTKKPFNKNFPSVIYFTGGPGSTARGNEFDLPNTNIIFFEQRGIACSRPETEELFKDPKFYSSINTARDAHFISKAYGISKITSYGQSYGTIPATIFASLYPNKVNNLIIEGVIFHGDKSLWNSERKKENIQNLYNNINQENKEKILSLTQTNLVPTNWFSKLANMVLYLNDSTETFNTFINGILQMDQDSLISFINNFYSPEKYEEEFSFGDVMMGMIGCQEISMNNPELSMTLIQNANQEFLYDGINTDNNERCVKLGLTKQTQNFYRAENYKVSVPTFYLLGETDGATDLDQGLNHFKYVPTQFKQALIMKVGGHLPSLSLLKDRLVCTDESGCERNQNDIMVDLFESIVRENEINNQLLEEFNAKGPLFFTLKNK